MNRNIKGDEEGEWTFTREMEESVIDYIIGDGNTEEGIEKMIMERTWIQIIIL